MQICQLEDEEMAELLHITFSYALSYSDSKFTEVFLRAQVRIHFFKI